MNSPEWLYYYLVLFLLIHSVQFDFVLGPFQETLFPFIHPRIFSTIKYQHTTLSSNTTKESNLRALKRDLANQKYTMQQSIFIETIALSSLVFFQITNGKKTVTKKNTTTSQLTKKSRIYCSNSRVTTND